jgi:hypothetical protein
MTTVVFFVIGFLIITKLLDVLSTLRLLRDPMMETNPIARRLMLRFGMKGTVWLIFIVAIILVATSGVIALYEGVVYQVAFILVGSFISVIQFAVAYTNWTGADTFITRTIRKLHSSLSQIRN